MITDIYLDIYLVFGTVGGCFPFWFFNILIGLWRHLIGGWYCGDRNICGSWSPEAGYRTTVRLDPLQGSEHSF